MTVQFLNELINNLVLGRPPQWWYVCTAGVQQGLEGVQQRLEGLHKQLKQNNYQLRLNQTSRTSQVGSRIIVDASNSSVKSSINNSINCFYKLRGSMRSRRGPKTNSWSRRQHRVGRSRSSSSSSSSSDPSDSVPREQDRIFKVIDKDQVCMDLGCVLFKSRPVFRFIYLFYLVTLDNMIYYYQKAKEFLTN